MVPIGSKFEPGLLKQNKHNFDSLKSRTVQLLNLESGLLKQKNHIIN